jgi:ankyrin repeat protein
MFDFATFLFACESNDLQTVQNKINSVPDMFGPRFYRGAVRSAVSHENIDILRTLLQHQPRVVPPNALGSALDTGSLHGNTDAVELLLGAGARVSLVAVSHAVDSGNMSLLELLLPSTRDSIKATVFLKAAASGHTTAMQILLDAGAEVPASALTQPLMSALQNGHEQAVRMLVDMGAQFEDVDSSGITVLMKACQGGILSVVTSLIAQGADINACTRKTEFTPIRLAAAGGHAHVVRALLDAGAQTILGEELLLVDAAGGGCLDLVNHILPNMHLPARCCSEALSAAASAGHVDIVEAMLAAGIGADQRCEDEPPALQRAAVNGHAEVVRALIRANADIHATYKPTTLIRGSAVTAVGIAVDGGHATAVQYLLEAGALGEDPVERESSADRAMVLLRSACSVDVIRVILDSIPDSVDIDINCLLSLAVRRDDADMTSFLLSRGADPNTTIPVSAADVKAIKQGYPGDSREYSPVSALASTVLDLAVVTTSEGVYKKQCRTTEVMRVLLEGGARTTDSVVLGDITTTVLHLAVMRHTRAKEALTVLLDASSASALACRDSAGDTPLIKAVKSGQEWAVRPLGAAGADPDALDGDGLSAMAALQVQLMSVKTYPIMLELINIGVSEKSVAVSPRVPESLWVRHATAANDTRWLRLLLGLGMSPSTAYDCDFTPLMFACGLGSAYVETVRVLLDAGAEVNARDHQERTALFRAAIKGDLSAVPLLLAAGADVFAQDNKGMTALMLIGGNGKSDAECNEINRNMLNIVANYLADEKRMK